ncbi:MAG: hypothetical protein JW682_03515 [Campylobacterales bacterium]|nr:hypothetical protein [Campylobacterales bacterium]
MEPEKGDTKSQFTSWTTDRNTAKRFSGRDGVILESKFTKEQQITSPDNYRESEVLIQGTVKDAKVTTP